METTTNKQPPNADLPQSDQKDRDKFPRKVSIWTQFPDSLRILNATRVSQHPRPPMNYAQNFEVK